MRSITGFILLVFILNSSLVTAQDTTSAVKSSLREDSTKKKSALPPGFSVRKAVIRSALIPGWGQIYNRKVWKVPIIYGALGTTAALFFRNLSQYRDSRDAYRNARDGNPANDYLIPQPYFNVKDQPEKIRNFRDEVRQNIDYTVIFFLIFWGANVADAAVDAHLKSFDVSDDLSLRIAPGYSPLAGTNGISVYLLIK